ncbi:sugar ABC transporter ATPase [Trinickia caryophylli]|uniref:Sugar ABC transporter ATPase n=1 Tax=Trinickia caryophylli TaxID=28094 RepID=A0A1X7DVP2_TRICW|nr:hypothetical protein [Trinickia caryophylli]PMS14262.1 sugar ABC transporter ATPase [Trinickia caryophylli]TRX17961.1 sugar ABC transporter ATPase [Trinickia caryophylli]WQE11261.1 sugar ABC transporter ATPase [Trinickia caryophylli]SMF22584.1 hypothetical protein SAMN06295900_10499 [Trinickia caryophylli]GLU32409.1 hypothetical protein Busp01_22510 [Trinickia caryophylli]
MPKPFAALAAFTLLGLTACGSAPTPSAQTGGAPAAARGSDSLMAFTSRRPATAIASCLEDRVHAVRRTAGGTATQLEVGRQAWLITLAPAGSGTAVNVRRSADDGPVSEPEMRFHIARCVV